MTNEGPPPATGEPTLDAAPDGAPASPAVAPSRHRVAFARLAFILAAAIALSVLGYLAIAVPDRWVTVAPTLSWGPKDLQVARGSARIVGEELHVMPADASGLAVVSLRTSLKATDYAAIEWIAIDVPDHVDISLLWRTDYKPDQINSMPLVVVSGRPLRIVTRHHAAWLGNIEGLALALRGPLAEPVRIRGVVAKTMSAREVLVDRVREWFAFEAWTGASINTVTGGADLQDLPLPLLLAVAVALAALVVIALRRFRPASLPIGTFTALAVLVVAAWIALDARWMLNLVRQVDATAAQFGGKSWRDKRLAVEDGPLFAFIEKAKEAMPDTPARVFVVADSPYFRGRAAYHLYPHNAYGPRSNALPSPSQLRPGDWLLVYHRRGIQYDASQRKLRWDDVEPVSAELKATARGAALFVLL